MRSNDISDPGQHLLIVESVPPDHALLPRLLNDLDDQSVVDLFTARQRLIGRGPNLLAKGLPKELEPLAAILVRQSFCCWMIPANRLYPVPVRLRSLSSEAGGLTLMTSAQQVRLNRGDQVLAVLADLSGNAVDKQIRHQMAGKIYHGVETASPLGDEELYSAILRGQPILDLYLFDNQARVRVAVRVQPGRYEPKGLGTRMQLSSSGNLEQVLHLVREYAGHFTLSLDFGFANLPGCTLHKAGNDPRLQRENLQSLTRFGFLLTEMAGTGALLPAAPALPESLKDRPQDLEYVSGLLSEIRGEVEDPPEKRVPESPLPDSLSLPPPPVRPRCGSRTRPGILSLLAGGAGLGVYFLAESRALWPMVYSFGIRPGLLPGLMAVVCLWSGFYFLRLKRRVENLPTSRIRSVAMGLVEVQGRARRKFGLVSPMTHLPCVYYRLRRYRRDRRNNWRLISTSDSGHVLFYLEDESGVLTVDPAKATIRTGHRQTGYGGPSDLFFASSAALDRDEKWIEEAVAEGSRLYILGEAVENRKPRLPLREQLTLALRSLKGDAEAMERYDADGDGKISAEEWNRARLDVEERLLHRNLGEQGPEDDRRDRVVIRRPGQRSLPFIIAETASEAHLVRGYGLYAIPLFGGAILAVIWTVFMLADFLQLA